MLPHQHLHDEGGSPAPRLSPSPPPHHLTCARYARSARQKCKHLEMAPLCPSLSAYKDRRDRILFFFLTRLIKTDVVSLLPVNKLRRVKTKENCSKRGVLPPPPRCAALWWSKHEEHHDAAATGRDWSPAAPDTPRVRTTVRREKKTPNLYLQRGPVGTWDHWGSSPHPCGGI